MQHNKSPLYLPVYIFTIVFLHYSISKTTELLINMCIEMAVFGNNAPSILAARSIPKLTVTDASNSRQQKAKVFEGSFPSRSTLHPSNEFNCTHKCQAHAHVVNKMADVAPASA